MFSAAEEVGLHVHLLDFQLALLDPLVHPLVTRIEAADMAAHGDDAGLLGDFRQVFGVGDAVGHRNFDQHMLARAHHLLALAEMHLGRRRQNHRVGALDAFAEIAGVMGNPVFLGHFRGRVLIAADQRADFDSGNPLQRVEMLLAEGALAGDADLHHWLLRRVAVARAAARRVFVFAARLRFSRMMCPTAVFEAGTV